MGVRCRRTASSDDVAPLENRPQIVSDAPDADIGRDRVDAQSEQSFPASDPPSWSQSSI
jgi:hypothetical protein